MMLRDDDNANCFTVTTGAVRKEEGIVREGGGVLDKTTGRIPALLPLIVWAAYQLVLSKFNQNNYESANNNKKREREKQKHTNGSERI